MYDTSADRWRDLYINIKIVKEVGGQRYFNIKIVKEVGVHRYSNM